MYVATSNSQRFLSPRNVSTLDKLESLLNPRGRYPKRFRLDSMNSVHQLLERHGQVGIHDHLVEQMSVEEFDSCSAVQNFVKLFVLKARQS